MNRGFILGLTILVAGMGRVRLEAQEVLKPFRSDDDVPVRRAEPVRPVATPIPMAKPTPSGRAPLPVQITPVPTNATPRPRQAPPKATPVPSPDIPEPGGEIRLSPTGSAMTADQLQLNVADGYYSKQMYQMAAPEYEKYLGLYPEGADKQTVLFRLGESYRRIGTLNAAKTTYETLLANFTDGEFIGPASYRLAELYYSEKNFRSALPLYRRASVRLRDPKLINSAKFFTGRCLEGLGQKLEARVVYEELVGSVNDNPFMDASRLSLALLLKDSGRTADALKQVQALLKQSENADLKVEAAVRAGLWEIELDQAKKAQQDLEAALQLPNIGRWKLVAEVGLLQMQFNAGKYKEVIDRFNATSEDYNDEVRPQLMVLVANAHRQLDQRSKALGIYEQVMKDYPDSLYAKEAAYERLVCLYQGDADNIVTEIDTFLANNPEAVKRDQVQLMKAEVLFKKQDYANAGPLYENLQGSRQLTGAYKAKALFKLGWCYMQTKDHEKAIAAFTSLVNGFPTADTVGSALFYRGLARMRMNNLQDALKDFDLVVVKYSKAKEREVALEQKALIQGKLNDNNGMAATYKLLLKDYPKTSAAADANYWIGWVAYENKDYKDVPGPLEQARKLDSEKYFERASLRILLSYYYADDWESVGREIDVYTKESGKGQVPEQVIRGISGYYFKTVEKAWKSDERPDPQQLQAAEKYLRMLTQRPEAKPDDFLMLGQTRYYLSQYKQSVEALGDYLKTVKEPGTRALGLLTMARSQIGLNDLAAAQKSVDEALSLQADGKVNAEARISAGDVQMARGNLDEAGKLYESVSVIIDDEEVTPRALEKAVGAYQQAGKEAESKQLYNVLKSRYPEYYQRKKNKP